MGSVKSVDWRGILLLAVGANLDNLGVGISYGVRGVRVGWQANAVIAGIALLSTAGSMLLGHGAAKLLPIGTARHIGSVIIFLVGLWIGLEAWLDNLEPAPDNPRRLLRVSLGAPGLWLEVLRDPQQADVDRSGVIDLKEAGLLGIALSLNNLGTGLGAGLNGYPVAVTTALTAAFSWLTVSGGEWLGRVTGGRWKARGAGYLAMLILICLAVWEWRH